MQEFSIALVQIVMRCRRNKWTSVVTSVSKKKNKKEKKQNKSTQFQVNTYYYENDQHTEQLSRTFLPKSFLIQKACNCIFMYRLLYDLLFNV